jgi:hypothetical protein
MTNEAKKRAGSFAAAKEQWLKLVASYPNLSGSDKAVAIMLSVYMNSKTRDAWPSMQRLASDTNLTRSTVWRSLKRLEKFKLLGITHARCRRKTNHYRPLLGLIDANPKALGRKTSPRGLMLRTRNVNAANSQHISCELAARTSEEPQMKSRSLATEGATVSRGSTAAAVSFLPRRSLP